MERQSYGKRVVSLEMKEKPANIQSILNQVLDMKDDESRKVVFEEMRKQYLRDGAENVLNDKTKQSIDKSADAIIDQIRNLRFQFSGQPKQVRYSPEVLRMAISVCF